MTQRVMALDATMLNTLQACPYKLNLQFILNLRGLTKPHFLDEGSLIHVMLWMYYQLKRDRVPFQERVERSLMYGRLMSPDLDLSMDECEIMYYQFKEYCKYYEDEDWSPIAFERPFSVLIYEDENLKVLYEGRVDLIVRISGGEQLVVDHKTMTRRSDLDQMSNQFMGYSYCLGINTVCVNRIGFQKTLAPKERFTRPMTSYNKERLEEWKANVIYWAKRGDEMILDGQFPMNQTSCDKFGGCFYRPLCLAPQRTRSYLAMRNYKIGEEWTPAGGLGLQGEVDEQ